MASLVFHHACYYYSFLCDTTGSMDGRKMGKEECIYHLHPDFNSRVCSEMVELQSGQSIPYVSATSINGFWIGLFVYLDDEYDGRYL